MNRSATMAAGRPLAAALLAALIALSVMLVVLVAMGYPPAAVATAVLQSAAGSRDRAGATLLAACPLILTGLAVCIAFRCGVWNIGAEGQYLLGALAAAAVGLNLAAQPWLVLPAALLIGTLAGAAWAGLAAWLKLARGVQEVLATILLNFVAVQMVALAVRGPLADPAGAARDSTASLPASCRLPLLQASSGLHVGLIFAVALTAALWFLLAHTIHGLRLRIVGGNPIAAAHARIPVARYAAAAFVLSGALAGLAGAVEITGNTHYLTAAFGSGYGYTAIAVAMLARLSPVAILPSALFFAALDTGVRGLQSADLPGVESVPTSLTFLAQGVVVLVVAWTAGPPRKAGDT